MSAQITKEWPWARREKLVKEIGEKIPYRYRYNGIKTRSFADESKKKLGSLFKEIEAHNKFAEKQNSEACDDHNGKRSEMIRITRFGTEEEVSKIAAQILK